jgi:hypothetical protein
VPDQQQTPIGPDGAQGVEGLTCVIAAGKRRIDLQAPALVLAPPLDGELRGAARPHLRAAQHGLEVGLQQRQREARSARLGFAANRQPAR